MNAEGDKGGGRGHRPPPGGYTTPPPEGGQPWERWPGETGRAYEAFLVYREMDRGSRSITKVAQKLDKSRTLIGRWSKRWRWIFRSDHWDAHVDRLTEQNLAERLGQLAERHEILARGAMAAASKALENLIAALSSKDNVPAYGAVIASVDTIIRLQQDLAAQMRERLERTGIGGVPVDIADAREELERRLTLLAERRRTLESPQ